MNRRPPRRAISLPAITMAVIGVLIGCASEPRPLPPPKLPKVEFDTLISSRPDAVRCNVNGRSGKSLTVTTPRLVSLTKLKAPVRIRCFAEGYWNGETTILAGSRGPLLIRALDGEQIKPGFASVRGSEVGPGGEFPREVTVTLRRDMFESPTSRDLYYAEQLSDAMAAWQSLIDRARSECATTQISQKGRSAVSRPIACRDGLRRLQDLQRADLQLIEQQRRRSTIP